ncbi:PEP-CTERM sorting domain-containing protein [Anabaena sp. UHCC 0253]|uniref:LEVG family PEP-CTERM protein n=1 Tax=Anabaena sp. UHCC 0253 TaxID=2590019 RepID=UPI0014450AA5|nr:LEVG family PEP-CTERM protein [Anabaena sp. UHCC 0253]MTJ52006.1 PEP-CTERM sorting domain-containing protein [Anabaena sp. UHCC 0253]
MTKFNSLAATLAASAVGLSLFGGVSQAQAASLVPSTEGEIQTNLACVTGSCIDTTPLGYTIESLVVGNGYKESLLFSDDSETANDYGFGINFLAEDEGTNSSGGNWFRPVAVKADGTLSEDGQLEVGKFKFTFDTTIEKLKLTFFDVEDIGTKISNIIGGDIDITPGLDGNIKIVTLSNVNSFNLHLGRIGGKFNPGDGARLQASVPEPTTILGLGALGVASAFGLRKGKKASQAV